MLELIAANAAFVGTHFAMSHPLRPAMAKMLGAAGLQMIYSIISLATFAWVSIAFQKAPPVDLIGSGAAGWIIATILTLPAVVLLAGSLFGNPALPTPMAQDQARAEPAGVFTITRHPMLQGFGVWALSHIVLFSSTRTMITAFAMGFLVLVGAHMQDRKKRELLAASFGLCGRWGYTFGAGSCPVSRAELAACAIGRYSRRYPALD
ncbi:MAG: NnrU family protein [Pseudomonadota bacterium]